MKRLRFLRDCSSAFNVVCQRMEQRMAYGQNEQMETVLKDALSRRRASAHGCEGFGFGLQEFRVCSHGRPPAHPPARVVRRERRGLPFSENREPEACGIDRFVVPLLIACMMSIYLVFVV